MSADESKETIRLAPGVMIGRSHDPSTGEEAASVMPADAPEAERIKELIRQEALRRGEAVEVVYAKGAAHWRMLPRSPAVAFTLLARARAEGKLDDAEVVKRISVLALKQVLAPRLDIGAPPPALCRGLGVNLGAATGVVAQSAAEVALFATQGKASILFVEMTKPEDMGAMQVAVAIVTTTGGPACHAAILSTQMGKPCIVRVGEVGLSSGQEITVDAATGHVYAGALPLTVPQVDGPVHAVLSCADRVAKLKVYANADTAADAQKARELGARGIGLMRTEHMFFSDQEHRDAMLMYVLGKKPAIRSLAISKLRALQYTDFHSVFRQMRGFPVTVRLMDPPLSEFLPAVDDKDAVKHAAEVTKTTHQAVRDRIKELRETNPMLGHRGCRLGVTAPELYRAQANSALRAAWDIREADEQSVLRLGIMLPLVTSKREAVWLVNQLRDELASTKSGYQKSTLEDVPVEFGAMLETPRACLDTVGLAEVCDFFSFGTNDLTQMTWALSRDDASTFMPKYAAAGLVEQDPFVTLDRDGVGALMDHAINSLGDKRKDVSFAICGEHGGDPASIALCVELGLNYVSCSPYRIPIARLAAGRASLGLDVGDQAEPDSEAAFLLPADSELLTIGAAAVAAPEEPAIPTKYDKATRDKLKGMVPAKDPGWWKIPSGLSAEQVAARYGGWRVLLKEAPYGKAMTAGHLIGNCLSIARIVVGFTGVTAGSGRGQLSYSWKPAPGVDVPNREWLDQAVHGGYLIIPWTYVAGVQPDKFEAPPEFAEPSLAAIAPPILGAAAGAKVKGAKPSAEAKGKITSVDDAGDEYDKDDEEPKATADEDEESESAPKPAPSALVASVVAVKWATLYVKTKSAPDPKKPYAKMVGHTTDESFVVVAFPGSGKPWVKPDSFPAFKLTAHTPAPDQQLWIFLPDEVQLATSTQLGEAGLLEKAKAGAFEGLSLQEAEAKPFKTALEKIAELAVGAGGVAAVVKATTAEAAKFTPPPAPSTDGFVTFVPTVPAHYQQFAQIHAGKCITLQLGPMVSFHARVIGFTQSAVLVQLHPAAPVGGHNGMGALGITLTAAAAMTGSGVVADHKDLWYLGAGQKWAPCKEHN